MSWSLQRSVGEVHQGERTFLGPFGEEFAAGENIFCAEVCMVFDVVNVPLHN